MTEYTNEELVLKIQAGERDLLLVLWNQVKPYAKKRASRFLLALGGRFSVDRDDLVQAGYLALVDAVRSYAQKDGAAFLTWYTFFLRSTFADAAGVRTSKRDLLDNCESLDEPLTDDPDGSTLLDVVADPDSSAGYDAIDQTDYISRLRQALDAALGDISPDQAEAIRRYYYQGQTENEAAASLEIRKCEFARRRRSGLHAIRTGRHGPELMQFSPYSGTGLQAWKNTGHSVQERYVIRKERLLRQRAKE